MGYSNIVLYEEEYQQIRQAKDVDKAFLDEWFTLDKNAVPPEWRLNPRVKGGDYDRYEDWQPVEARLQRILADAVNRVLT